VNTAERSIHSFTLSLPHFAAGNRTAARTPQVLVSVENPVTLQGSVENEWAIKPIFCLWRGKICTDGDGLG
jgi:hypothetical protein